MNTLDPIKELYNLNSDKEEALKITEIIVEGSDMGDGPVDSFMDL